MSQKSFKFRLLRLVNMSDDLDREGAAANIRSGIRFQGANVFILTCRILKLDFIPVCFCNNLINAPADFFFRKIQLILPLQIVCALFHAHSKKLFS